MQEQLRSDLKEAMKAKEEPRLTVLRGLITACTNELVAKGKTPRDVLSDEDTMVVIKRLVKQRKDSIEQYTKANRPDLAEGERGELHVLEAYLPESMSKADILKVAIQKRDEMGVTDKAQMGMLMGAIMKELQGKADGADVRDVVTELFL